MIRLLWESDGPVDFDGQFYTLHHARLDTEPYDGRLPPIWIGASGPRMLDIAGRYADGWWPAGAGRRSTTPRCSPRCGPPPTAPAAIRWRSPRASSRSA